VCVCERLGRREVTPVSTGVVVARPWEARAPWRVATRRRVEGAHRAGDAEFRQFAWRAAEVMCRSEADPEGTPHASQEGDRERVRGWTTNAALHDTVGLAHLSRAALLPQRSHYSHGSARLAALGPAAAAAAAAAGPAATGRRARSEGWGRRRRRRARWAVPYTAMCPRARRRAARPPAPPPPQCGLAEPSAALMEAWGWASTPGGGSASRAWTRRHSSKRHASPCARSAGRVNAAA
jgi:hypothetical protein